MPTEEIILPLWFRKLKKAATELSVGFGGAYYILHQYVDLTHNPKVFEIFNLSIISLGLPCIILSCSNVLDILKRLRTKNG